jgi:hypothetical protein
MSVSLSTVIKHIAEFRHSKPEGDREDFSRFLADSPGLAMWDRRDVYQACLGRLPEQNVMSGTEFNWSYGSPTERADHLIACLLCDEFRSNFLEIFGAALPDVRRVFFIHVPRTAGTSFTLAIEKDHGSLTWHTSFVSYDWLAIESSKRNTDPLRYILDLLAQFDTGCGDLFVMGHEPMSGLLSKGYIRSWDLVCTIIRDPSLICRSVLNYVIDRASGGLGRPDAEDWRMWLTEIGCEGLLSGVINPAEVRLLLRSERFRAEYSNLLTRSLSLDGTVEGALYALNLVRCAVLLPETAGDWAHKMLNLQINLDRKNGSSGMASAVLAPGDWEFIHEELCADDLTLYAHLMPNSLWAPTSPAMWDPRGDVRGR